MAKFNLDFLGRKNIRDKLAWIAMSATGIAVLLAFAVSTASLAYKSRSEMRDQLTALADVTGRNSTKALMSLDRRTAEEMLAALGTRSNILSAEILDKEHHTLASYRTPPSQTSAMTKLFPALTMDAVERPIAVMGRRIGSVRITADLGGMWHGLMLQAIVNMLGLAVAALVSYFVMRRMSDLILEPIKRLAKAAREISRSQQYALRVDKSSDDELGELTEEFNNMLSQIEDRDNLLKGHRYILEHEVMRRTAQLLAAKEVAEVANQSNMQLLDRERDRVSLLEKLARGASLNEVLETLAMYIEREIKDSLCSVLLLDEQRKHLLIGTAPHLPEPLKDAVLGLEIGLGAGPCGTAAYTGQRVIVANIQTHPSWEGARELASRVGVAACWSQPIFNSEGKVLGTFAIYHPTPHSPDAENLALLEYAANLAGIAIQRKQSEDAILRAKASAEEALERASMAEREIINISEETRERIGQELHDGLGQSLTGVAFLSEVLSTKLKKKGWPEMELVSRITVLLNDAVLNTRQLAQGLYPVELEGAGLQAMLEQLANQVRSIYRINCSVYYDENFGEEARDVAINLFRIAQEAVNNSIKHGVATRIIMRAVVKPDIRLFEIADNGIGIRDQSNRDGREGQSGLGMHTMQHRASLIGATLSIGASSDGGTSVAVSIPVQ